MGQSFDGGGVAGDEGVEQVRGQQRDVDLMEALGPGQKLAERLGAFGGAAEVLLASAQGRGGNDFKIPLLRRTLVAVLRELTGGDAR